MLVERGGEMYAEAGLLYPYFQCFSQELQQLEEFCFSQKTNASMSHLAQMSTIMEYDLGAEGDLFKAPEPIIEEPVMGLDPMTAAMSMIPCGEDVISPQGLKVSDIESIQSEQLLSEVFYECKKDLLAKTVIESPLSEVLDIKIPVARMGETQAAEEKALYEGLFQKSVSSGCLSSMEWVNGTAMRPNFLDFPGMDFGAAYGMRRAFSDGDIKTLGNGQMSLIRTPLDHPVVVSNYTPTEDRQKKLSRYRNKRTKRNFGRKIKYACRKALADSQPRIRGRFAKTEELDMTKRQ
ncbi:hypothetical protein VitviT2T_025431 [Vitis vinifera]|uniref:CCT domain-containing protein n=4 Tax=Vitis vinifera TaxID=29760 RepID=A0ABY9DKP1_VITVI|eukprot:XP_002268568.1 PREDICTED: zinc finger protein CONSTANS-LIKE 1 isoform X1 [Vitis vinifera]